MNLEVEADAICLDNIMEHRIQYSRIFERGFLFVHGVDDDAELPFLAVRQVMGENRICRVSQEKKNQKEFSMCSSYEKRRQVLPSELYFILRIQP